MPSRTCTTIPSPRNKVLKRFMDVMGPESPGLAVRKCQRSGRGTRSVGIGGPEVRPTSPLSQHPAYPKHFTVAAYSR